MPNWVRNRLIIESDDYQDIINDLTTKTEDGDRNFNFNKIIEMPRSVANMISGTITEECKKLFRYSIKNKEEYTKYAKYFKKDDNEITSVEEYKKLMESCLGYKDTKFTKNGVENKLLFETEDNVLFYGKTAYENLIKYGAQDWYDWAMQNWGVKWNASETIVDGNTIEFDTPWDSVTVLMSKVAQKYPHAKFTYEFSEEQISVYGGRYVFENGDVVEGGFFEEFSKEMYENAFSFWPGVEDYYKFDEKTNTYISKQNEGESEM